MTGEFSPPPTGAQLGAGSNPAAQSPAQTPALLGPKAFAQPWLSQATLDHCHNVGLIQRTFSSSLQKTLMHHSDPSLLLASRAMAGEREISVGECLPAQPVHCLLPAAATEAFPVIWHTMNRNDF